MSYLSSIFSIILSLIVFSVLIIIHEFGHLIAAKKQGILVEEFSFGLGPAIFSKTKGDTLYSIRIFPLGGYCRMLTEDELPGSNMAFGCKSV